MKEFILDIETLPNYTLFLFTDFDGGEYPFEIWKKTNTCRTEMPKFVKALAEDDIVYSYNGNRFDLVILEQFLKDPEKWDSRSLAELAQDIIYEVKRFWRPKFHFRQGDIQEILNLNRKEQVAGEVSKRFFSLKEAAANIGFAQVKDLPVDPEFDITLDQKKLLRAYCSVDCRATAALVEFARKEIEMREGMSQEHGMGLLNHGEPRLAKKILVRLYEKQTGDNAYDLKAAAWGKTEEEIESSLSNLWLNFRDLVPGPKHFRWCHPEFKALYEKMRAFSRHNNAIKKESRFHDTLEAGPYTFNLGEGGIHSAMDTPGIWRSTEEGRLYQVDASSFYPYIILNRGYLPRHLPGIGDLFRGLVETRIAHKKAGRKVEADRQKIVINSFFGQMNDRYSPIFDPYPFMSTILTGQLYFLQLTDWFMKVGVEILLANTDGLIVRVEKSQEEDFRKVVSFFSEVYNLTMDIDDLGLVVKKNVNSYLLVDTEGNVIKGTKDFRAKIHPKRPMAGMIVAKALVAYFVEGKPVEQTINESDDILDFLFVKASSKRSWRVQIEFPWADAPVILQNTQRWYVSKRGGYMRREAIHSNRGEAIMKGVRVMPLLNIEDYSAKYYGDLDRSWYIQEAGKKVKEILKNTGKSCILPENSKA